MGMVLSLHPEPTELGVCSGPMKRDWKPQEGANIPLYDNWQNDFWRGIGMWHLAII